MPKRIAAATACAAFVSLAAAAPAAAQKPDFLSWGKVGVAFDQYRADAVECGRAGYYLDLSETEQAKLFKRASSRLEANEAGLQDLPPLLQTNVVLSSAQIVEGTRPSVRFAELRTLQESSTTACLRERGYTRFKLTEPQQAELKRLRRGSPERHIHLHRLASDAAVLEAQKLGQPKVLVEPTDQSLRQ